ncbi:hypothetical protein [Microbacterium sp. SORGH_AS_0888]|uniref:hypothetical protein n=1 Tax=Microbacterium sp. SORGH_AS_0888 TaxID=3041791 RepID=UPI002780A553|nr:hypothetical protein [Microbacterium sp. SORGH_AS_0888]MDQ1130762.1 hypothetical protein [Microbacterium sp. SORGH_AS_0888]
MPLNEAPVLEASTTSRRPPVWPWFVSFAGLVVSLAVAGAGLALVLGAREAALSSRAVSPAQERAIAAAIAGEGETAQRIASQRAAYRADVAAWDADEAEVAAWRARDDVPPAGVANPGGQSMPGDDPTGRAFLDSIGATAVQLVFDAGPGNCGYNAGGDEGWSYAAGGCYDSDYRNRLFLAWDPGAESLVRSVFVHEAMHWYQYEHYYPVFVRAARAGIFHDDYAHDIESDASCRAVFVHGIPREDYEDSSSPCDVDDWYEGWLPDRLVALGAVTTPPVAAAYEVSEVIRP